ncbi:MAG: Fic family protein [Proteobacteria bacterium]|nr:Fic family protein [Pseudomonadota bacterium]
MRKFEETHSWISFGFNLGNAPPELWINLGEAASKCEHLSMVPLRPATATLLHRLYLAKGVQATTAIEGNTLSEAEVLKAVDGKLEVPPSKQYLKQEVDNIIASCNSIGKQLSERTLPAISPELISSYDRQILTNLTVKEGEAAPGELRNYSVAVGNVYRGAPPEDCPYLLDRLCQWLNGPDFQAKPGLEMLYAIIKAVVAHLYLAWIHPFGDGNGRTARLLEFHIMFSAGIPSPAAHLLSNHYNQTRTEYYRQLDIASKSGGDILPFLHYAVQGLVDGLREQLDFVWKQQWDVVWRNYVHERFQEKNSPSDIRQRHLALDLGAKGDWVQIPEITELTPRLAKAYAGKTSKTVKRDLNVLKTMELIVMEGRKIRAKREIIQSFLPLRKISDKEKA